MLNRMDYWSALAKAALISQDTRYLDQAKDFLLNWIEQHPRIEPSLSTRTLDTGIRVVNMLECAMLLEASEKLSDEELTLILTSVENQLAYLKANSIEKYTLSNWGSIQTCGTVSYTHLDVYKRQCISNSTGPTLIIPGLYRILCIC